MTDNIIKLDEYWPYQVVVLADLIAKHTTSVLKTHGDLNLSQWRVLAAIAENPGRTAAEVVAVTPMDKGIVSRATATLVEDGIIEKVTDTNDKRRSQLYPTTIGQTIYKDVSEDLTARTDKINIPANINAELTHIIQTMNNLTDI